MKIIGKPLDLSISPALAEYNANPRVRPLDICPICRYVRCRCGGCHSRQCAQPCGYESSSATARTLDSDGKSWCEACGGNYLPHVH